MTLIIIIFVLIGGLIVWAAYKSGWEWKATIAAVASFLGAVWAAFLAIGNPTP